MNSNCKVEEGPMCDKPAIIECQGKYKYKPLMPPNKLPASRKANLEFIDSNGSETFTDLFESHEANEATEIL